LDCIPLYSPKTHVHREFTLKPSHLILRLTFVFTICLASLFVKAQKYPAFAIPDSLKENAEVVVRLAEIVWDIKSAGEATLRKHFVYTILSEKGEGYAEYRAVYNTKSRLINSINAYLYDANGKEIRHFKKKDMEDFPYEDGFFPITGIPIQLNLTKRMNGMVL